MLEFVQLSLYHAWGPCCHRIAFIFVVEFTDEDQFSMISSPFCRLASTPAMFNSTLTEDHAFLCPVDGSIMITGMLPLLLC